MSVMDWLMAEVYSHLPNDGLMFKPVCFYCIEGLGCSLHTLDIVDPVLVPSEYEHSPFPPLNSQSWTNFFTRINNDTDRSTGNIQEVIIERSLKGDLPSLKGDLPSLKRDLPSLKGDLPSRPVLAQLQNQSKHRMPYERFRDKAFMCDHCERTFTLKSNLQNHIRIYHTTGSRMLPETRTRRMFKCSICDMTFRTMDKARAHDLRFHQPIKLRQFPCEQCQKMFFTRSNLNEHIAIAHRNERPFICTECGSTFGRRNGLRRHSETVHGNKTFECPFPDCFHPGYKCSKALSAHIRSTHTHERPFECDDCGKCFVRRNDMKMHQLSHKTHDNMYQCPNCADSFELCLNLKKHLKNCKSS